MREVVYGAACSLDGFITGPNGEIDWLEVPASRPAVDRYLAEFWDSVDTLIMGRKTYEDTLKYASAESEEMMSSAAAAYVFSRTLTGVKGSHTHLVRDDAAAFVRTLKEQPGKRIWLFGGGDFARSMLAADLVDEIDINVIPVLLGAGARLFEDAGRRVQLDQVENRGVGGGCMRLRYRVLRS